MTASQSGVDDASEELSPPQDDAAKGPSTTQRMMRALDPYVVLSKADGHSVEVTRILRICLILCYPVWVVLVLAAMALYYALLAVLVVGYLLWQGVVLAAKGVLIAVYIVGWVASLPVRALFKKKTPEEDKNTQGEPDEQLAAS